MVLGKLDRYLRLFFTNNLVLCNNQVHLSIKARDTFFFVIEVYQLVKIREGSLSKENRRYKGTEVGKSAELGERAKRSGTGMGGAGGNEAGKTACS